MLNYLPFQISENLPTDKPSVTQPVAEAQPDPSHETNYDAIYEVAYQLLELSYSKPHFKSGNVPEVLLFDTDINFTSSVT